MREYKLNLSKIKLSGAGHPIANPLFTPKASKPGKICRMPVAEEGDRVFQKSLNVCVSIPRDEYGRVAPLAEVV